MEQERLHQRLMMVARHIHPQTSVEEGRQEANIAADPCSQGMKTTAYASATGRPSKYAKMHGDVSSGPAVWQDGAVDGPPLQDVTYETAVGEGIAKVLPVSAPVQILAVYNGFYGTKKQEYCCHWLR